LFIGFYFNSISGLKKSDVEYLYKYSVIYEKEAYNLFQGYFPTALLHKYLKGKAPLIEPNLRRNFGKWST